VEEMAMLLADVSDPQSHKPQFSPHDRDPSPPTAMEALAVVTRYGRSERIYTRDDPVDHWSRIVSGMARKSALSSDGRRRIIDFLLPSDSFGFSPRNERSFDVECVISGTTVARYPRGPLEALAEVDPEVGRQLRHMACDSISRLQARILILGRVTATEKVCAFLVDMAERSSGGSDVALILQMSRYDIADYLALSVETVSRAITHLQHNGAITLLGRHCVQMSHIGEYDRFR
jgi:CRP/FNR family nitrogen fixation transcriptional regulator